MLIAAVLVVLVLPGGTLTAGSPRAMNRAPLAPAAMGGSAGSRPLLTSAVHDLVLSTPAFTGRVGEPVSFVATLAGDAGLAGETVDWSWGDGSTSATRGGVANWTYAQPGLYLVQASVTDSSSIVHDNAHELLSVPVLATHEFDGSGMAPMLEGWVVSNSSAGAGATAVLSPGGSVTLAVRLSEPIHAPTVSFAATTFTVPAGISSDVAFSNLVLDPLNTSTARLTLSPSTPVGAYPVNFTVSGTATASNVSHPFRGVFTFTLAVGSSLGGGGVNYPVSAAPGTLTAYEVGSTPGTLDPAIDYDSAGLEIFQNVYQTLIAPNGSSTGGGPAAFVPELATCVPGSSLCQSLYSSSLVSGDHYTFVLSKSPRFYDPKTGATWPVYPTDVVFSIARTLGFSTLPCFACNNGWMLAQALLPFGNPTWDGGIHGGANNTPSPVFAAMSVNDSTYCPTAASSENGCVTFTVNGEGRNWPFFLQLIANPWGGSIVPCGWFSAPAQGAGIPYWTEGNVSGAGDYPCRMPGTRGFGITPGSMTATGWDAWELAGSNPPYVGNVQWSMAGSGPYWLSNITTFTNYTLRSNTAFVADPSCDFSGCPNATGRIGTIRVVYESTSGPGLGALEAGMADVAEAAPGDGARLAADGVAGAGFTRSLPSLQFDFQAFNLDYNVTVLSQLTSVTTTAPATILTDLDLRQFLIHADPYATVQTTVYQENGTQWRFPYGAPPLPLFTGGGEPSNVSWGSGDPNPDPSVVGGAA
ncbi:MAG TPA: PKD domain-containing protein, partial [Thermoplasmata archaeon]|nr:PKD domain-containing protein [Thermoplasmata archaeon]